MISSQKHRNLLIIKRYGVKIFKNNQSNYIPNNIIPIGGISITDTRACHQFSQITEATEVDAYQKKHKPAYRSEWQFLMLFEFGKEVLYQMPPTILLTFDSSEPSFPFDFGHGITTSTPLCSK